MPKSKRAKIVHLSQVDKKGKEHTLKLFASVQTALEEYQYAFVFSVDNMRNSALKEVRAELDDSRIIFGKTTVMAKALGTTPESSTQANTYKLAALLTGNVGLLFTNRAPEDIIEHFQIYSSTDFARAGTAATRTFTVPSGIVYSRGGEIDASEDIILAHSIEPELRKLGMPTRLEKGKITLENEYEVCKEGKILDSRQTRLLKLFGVATAEFKVRLVAYWGAADQEIVEIPQEGEMEE